MKTLTLAGAVLAAWLGIVHVASFADGLLSARLASLTAILVLDLLVAAHVVSAPRLFTGLWVLVAALPVAGLHVDYLRARLIGAEHGVFGEPLATTKNLIIAAQLAWMAVIARRRWPARVEWRRLLRVEAADAALLLLVLVPLVNYFAWNRDDFTPASAAMYFLTLFAVPFAAFLIVQAWQRSFGAPPIAAPLVAALACVHYSMPMVSESLRRPIETLFLVQLALAAGVSAALAFVYRLSRQALVTGVVVFAIASGVTSGARAAAGGREDVSGTTATAWAPSPDVLDAPLVRRPSVYLLIYDGYAPPPVMAAYGIDNAETDAWLAREGFTEYVDAYSLYHASYASMSGVMNMGLGSPAGISGPTQVAAFFRQHGYRTHLVLNSYLLNANLPKGVDETFPSGQAISGVRALYRGIAGGEFKSETVFDDVPRDRWLAEKRAVLSAPHAGPRMVYAHSPRPGHSQNSGTCLPDETARYAARLAEANAEVRGDVGALLASDPGAIIIVASDHGAYLTGDCLYMSRTPREALRAIDIADRYGVKLAIRWPDAARPPAPATLQDVFLSVAAYLTGDARAMEAVVPPVTVGYGGIPDGAVRDGIVQVGVDRGRPLFGG